MHTAWIGTFGAALLCTAACASATSDAETRPDTSANTQGTIADVDSDGEESIGTPDSSEATTTTETTLAYGWLTKIPATKQNGFIEDFSLQDIVTNGTVKVREDNMACVTCHSWAGFADRQSFCDRVDAFSAEPTIKNEGKDPPNAKPAYLKTVLKQWKAAGCPN